MGPSRGYVVQKGQGNYVTTALLPVMTTGQTRPEGGRRRKTTVWRPVVSKITTQYQAGGKKAEVGDTTSLQPIYENETS